MKKINKLNTFNLKRAWIIWFNFSKIFKFTFMLFYARIFFQSPQMGVTMAFWKDPDDGKDWGQEERGTTEDEMVGWHHQLNGHGFGWTPEVGDGQGGLTCSSSQRVEHDWVTELNWRRQKAGSNIFFFQFSILLTLCFIMAICTFY